ncbi:DUF4184 family protein [Paenibacillus prosopidis]|uniref:Uncharacterized protein DUF4184 n=1 Tax=Paenibacillus prosopidis TaxID=630520 RepID=A0A368W681_9BACL|nr:DUF4184 family protein [Paenibacillus prosopidis]RCW50212.1 uncharacterized protein DUF4184 [Paenibacillus prosopidis]
MPFTLSHPLYAAPLKKAIPSLSVTGLVLGSMAPDIEYFIAMQPLRTIGHSLEGFFLITLPTCIAFAYAFHRVIKPVLPHFLPSIAEIDRFAYHSIRPWRLTTGAEWFLFCVSLLIGFASHVFMDNWTHSSGWFVQRIPFLHKIIAGDYVYHILQLSLSVLGAAVPALYFIYRWYDWYRNSKNNASDWMVLRPFKQQWLLLIFFSLLFLFGKLILSGSFFSLSIWVVAPITASILGLYIATMLDFTMHSNQSARGVWFTLALLGIIAIYKLLTYKAEFSVWLWIIFIWALSIVILLSSIYCHPNKQSN